MPRGLHLTFPLYIMLFANLSPKTRNFQTEEHSTGNTGATAWTAHCSWLHLHPYPGARGGPFFQRTQEGHCKLPAFNWDNKRWNKSCALVSARRKSLLSCSPDLAPAPCPPEVLQVQPAGHEPRTSSCCSQVLLMPHGLFSYFP